MPDLTLPAEGRLAEVARRNKKDGVTIFIPNWNHQSFLAGSVASALEGARAARRAGIPAEVVVVDDASRDGSQRLLRTMAAHLRAEDAFNAVFLPANLGLTGVRNLGLALAAYRSVLFLDADNELVPESLPVLYETARATGAALTYGTLIDVANGEVVGLRSNEQADLRLTAGNYIDALALVDAVQALEVGGYIADRALDYWADWEFVLHLIAEERVLAFVPIVAGRYRKVPLSMLEDAASRLGAGMSRIRRVFSQTGTREWDTRRVGRIYHPAVGYLDEEW